jgi:UDP-2,3-diacylglucosamine pyrophosphatase LpxH
MRKGGLMNVHRVKHAWIVSDLHLGAGGACPLEDFHDDGLFADWVGELAGAGSRSTLVLNGDIIDFLQIEVPAAGDPLPDDYLWDEATSVAKLRRCAEGHPAVFEALGGFVAAGGSLLVTVGNHDLDLAWPAVQAELHALVGAPGGTIGVGLVHRLFDTVHVEHGHRYTPENRPRDFDSFLHVWSGSHRVLECPWGSRFVIDEINPLEQDLPYLDNVKPILKVAYHLLMGDALEGRRFRTILKLLGFLKRNGLPPHEVADMAIAARDPIYGHAVHDAFDEGEPEWRSLVRRLHDDAPGEVEDALAGLDPDDHALLQQGDRVSIGEPVLGMFRSSREERAARHCLDSVDDQGAEYVVFGHTHDIVDGELDGRWFNPGSWIPHLDADAPDVANNGRPLLELAGDPDVFVSDRRAVHLISAGAGVSVALEDL